MYIVSEARCNMRSTRATGGYNIRKRQTTLNGSLGQGGCTCRDTLASSCIMMGPGRHQETRVEEGVTFIIADMKDAPGSYWLYISLVWLLYHHWSPVIRQIILPLFSSTRTEAILSLQSV